MITFSRVSKKFIIPNRKSLTLFKAISGGINNPSMHKSVLALDEVNFCIKTGESLGVIGPNGSGKSTLLRIIAGIYKPTSGVFQTDGVVTAALQSRIIFPRELSVRENIFLFGAIMGLNRKDIHRNYDRIINLAGLGDFTNAQVRVLSEGMGDRLAFAISVETVKDILLLDELVLAGDSKFKEKCLEIIMKLKKEGKTIILASHDLKIISEFCDKTLLLNKGSVLAFGKTEEVVNRYLEWLKN
jgi:ABC-type polysaccharide/polyol phosphate transport system ATPase subunit